jgi:osmotically-inducible protein OsmY
MASTLLKQQGILMSAVAYAPPAQKIDSDDLLADSIRNVLRSRFRAAPARLNVAVRSGVVTLRGVATSFYQKQLWLHTTWQIPAVERIDDQIRVESDWD